MYRKLFLIALVCVVVPSTMATAQEFTRYLTSGVLPQLTSEEFPEVTFEWKMAGEVQKPLNEGVTELAEKNFAVAEKHFSTVIELDQTFWPAYYYRGVCRKANNKLAEAEEDLLAALQLNSDWRILEQLGEVYEMQRNWNKASDHYKRAMEVSGPNVLPHYRAGALELGLGNTRKASKLLETCLTGDPTFAPAYVMQGLIKLREDPEGGDAIVLFDRALKADSVCMEALFWRGLLMVQNHRSTEALRNWDKLLTHYPNIPLFLLVRGFLHSELGNYDAAFNDLRKVVLSKGLNEDEFQAGQTSLDKAIDIDFATRYAMRASYGLREQTLAQFKKAFCLFITGKKQIALDEFDRAQRLEPAAVIVFMKALTYEHLGKHELALRHYQAALELDNDIFDAHKKRGIYRLELRDYPGAIADFTDMIRLQPESAVSHKLLGITKFHQEDYQGSAVAFSRYLESVKDDAEVLIQRGYVYLQLKQYKDAHGDFAAATALKPENVEYHNLLIETDLTSGDTLLALQSTNAAISQFAKDDHFYVIRAEIFISQRKWENAQADMKSAFEIISPIPSYMTNSSEQRKYLSHMRYLKGRSDFELGEYKEGIAALSEALKLDPANDDARYWRAKAYIKAGQKSSALRDLKTLKESGYKDTQRLYEELTSS